MEFSLYLREKAFKRIVAMGRVLEEIIMNTITFGTHACIYSFTPRKVCLKTTAANVMGVGGPCSTDALFKTHKGGGEITAILQPTFSSLFFNKDYCILIKNSLKFVPDCQINNKPALVQIMACSDNGLTPNWRQAIIKTNDGLTFWHARPRLFQYDFINSQWQIWVTNNSNMHFN